MKFDETQLSKQKLNSETKRLHILNNASSHIASFCITHFSYYLWCCCILLYTTFIKIGHWCNITSHCDLQFMEGMQLKYNKAAEQSGVHIVNACGYDSIPADMGISYLMRNFKGKTGHSPLQCTFSGLQVFHDNCLSLISAYIFSMWQVIQCRWKNDYLNWQ